jgi:hypothetical protein
MTMSQNWGYLLTGTKLCPRTGTNELDKGELREMRVRLGSRRKQLTRHMQKKNNKGGEGGKRKAAEEGKMGDVSKLNENENQTKKRGQRCEEDTMDLGGRQLFMSRREQCDAIVKSMSELGASPSTLHS